MNISIKEEKIINKWVRWYFPNDDSYYAKVKKFLDSNFETITGKRKYRNLIYYKLTKKTCEKEIKLHKNIANDKYIEKLGKPLLFFSKNKNKPELFLQLEKYDIKTEKLIRAFFKSHIKHTNEASGFYYFIKFKTDAEINKRKLCESFGIDYDSLPYKAAKIKRPDGTILIFNDAVRLLSYSSMESVNKEKTYIMKTIKQNLV